MFCIGDKTVQVCAKPHRHVLIVYLLCANILFSQSHGLYQCDASACMHQPYLVHSLNSVAHHVGCLVQIHHVCFSVVLGVGVW